MGMLELVLRLVGGLLLLLGNAFFVTTEFALTRVRQFSEGEFANSSGHRRAWEMTDRLEIYLTGCQVGITICSVTLGVVAEPAVAALLAPVAQALGLGAASLHAVSIILALVVINLLHVIVGEQIPTYLGIERTRTIARYLAPGLYWWTRVTRPVIYLADRVAKGVLGLFGVSITRSWTEAEEGGSEGPLTSPGALRSEMGEVLSRGTLSRERRVEVLRALEIGRTPVREIMVPREEMVTLSSADALQDNLAVMRAHSYDRYPLVNASPDDPRGILYTTAVFRALDALEAGERALQEVAAPPMTVPAELAVSALIDRFQDEGQELAFVTDEQGAVVGLVTATDAFEAIAGELEDPLDRE